MNLFKLYKLQSLDGVPVWSVTHIKTMVLALAFWCFWSFSLDFVVSQVTEKQAFWVIQTDESCYTPCASVCYLHANNAQQFPWIPDWSGGFPHESAPLIFPIEVVQMLQILALLQTRHPSPLNNNIKNEGWQAHYLCLWATSNIWQSG